MEIQIKENAKKIEKLIIDGYGKGTTNEWLEAWKLLKNTLAKLNTTDIQQFDEKYYDGITLSNWVGDMEMELGNDRKYEELKNFCYDIIYTYKYQQDDDYSCYNFHRAYANAFIELKEVEKGLNLYESFIKDYPHHEWWYVDLGRYFANDADDLVKAATYYERGIEAINDSTLEKEMLVEELIEVYEKLDNQKRIAELNEMMASWNSQKRGRRSQQKHVKDSIYKIESSPIKAEPKIGRNDPCPCGSGKKYKKCCGKSK